MLTYIQITRAKPKEKPYLLSDDNGLFLKVMPKGKKIWLLSKNINKQRICKHLGEYPAMSQAEAREVAKALIKQLTPVSQSYITAKTFKEIYIEWIELKKTQIKSWQDTDERAKLYLLPKFADVRFNLIQPSDFISSLKNDLLSRNKLETIKRVCCIIKQIEVFAFNCGYTLSLRFQNLQAVFPSPHVNSKHFNAPHYTELKDIIQNMIFHSLRARTIFDVILCGFYTLLRPNEYCSLEWDWIDLDNKLITVPAEVMKMKRAHKVPISRQLYNLLTARPHIGKYVFPSIHKGVHEHIGRDSLSKFLRRCGLNGIFVPHGIRSIGRTWLHDNNISYDVAEMCLAHHVGSNVSMAYDRSELLEQRTTAMQAWCDFVESCCKSDLKKAPL